MRLLQILVQKLLGALVLLAGILLVAGVFTADVRAFIDRVRTFPSGFPALLQDPAQIALGIVLVAVGVLCLLPALRLRRGRQITFEGPHGEVAFDLDSVATTVGRVVGKMPEVNKITVHVLPVDGYTKADISAEVVLNPPDASARQAANRVHVQMQRAAVQILGADQVARVGLTVKRILINVKRLQELPASEELAPAGAVAAGPVMEMEGLDEAEQDMHEEIVKVTEPETRPRAETRPRGPVRVEAPMVDDRAVDIEPVEVEPVQIEHEPYVGPAAKSYQDLHEDETTAGKPSAGDLAAAPGESTASPWDEPILPGEPLPEDEPERRDTLEDLTGPDEFTEENPPQATWADVTNDNEPSGFETEDRSVLADSSPDAQTLPESEARPSDEADMDVEPQSPQPPVPPAPDEDRKDNLQG